MQTKNLPGKIMIIGIYSHNDLQNFSQSLALMAEKIENHEITYQKLQPCIACAQLSHINSLRKITSAANEHSSLSIVADARIDNREHLAQKLDISSSELAQTSSEQLILLAYCKWGEDCIRHLIGDFAFAIYDSEKHTLFCARDFIGARPFFYCQHRDFFAFATTPEALFAIPQVSEKLNEPYLAAVMTTLFFFHKEQTAFADIKKLPPAHFIYTNNKMFSIKQYWNPHDIAVDDSYSDDKSVVETFLEIYREAVRCRINGHPTVGFHLSSGLDSCSVGALTLEQNKDAIAFAWHPQPTVEDSNTREYKRIASFLQHTNCHNLRYCPPTLETQIRYLYIDKLKTPSKMLFAELPVQQQAQQDNVTVMLSGWGGDEGMSHYGVNYGVWLLQNWRWKKFYEYAKQQEYSLIKSLIRLGPLQLFYFYKNMWSTNPVIRSMEKEHNVYYNQEFLKKTTPLAKTKVTSAAKEYQRQFLNQGHLAERITSWHISGAKCGIKYAFPLLDQRLVELALRLPMKYFIRHTTRFTMRLMCEKILPKEIAWNRQKIEPQRMKKLKVLYAKVVEKEQKNLLEKIPQSTRLKYMNVDEVLESVRKGILMPGVINILDL